jgi:hypothetical protein
VDEYHDPIDDKELAALRKKSGSLFDAQPKTGREAILKTAHIKHRLAAFMPLKMMVKRRDARIAELEAEIESLKPKNPDDKEPRRPGGDKSGQKADEPYEDYLKRMVTG